MRWMCVEKPKTNRSLPSPSIRLCGLLAVGRQPRTPGPFAAARHLDARGCERRERTVQRPNHPSDPVLRVGSHGRPAKGTGGVGGFELGKSCVATVDRNRAVTVAKAIAWKESNRQK